MSIVTGNEGDLDALKLDNQLCFPLYACSKEIVRCYNTYLDEIDLTYTQYITMIVLWDEKKINVKMLGEKLYLDSGTLTPVLKKLEAKGYITRKRSKEDERNLEINITKEGEALKERAFDISKAMENIINLTPDETKTLYNLLYKVIENVR